MLTLTDLTTPRTAAQWKAILLGALQGLGFVAQTGTGSGPVTLLDSSGNPLGGLPAGNYDVTITVVASGEPAAATYNYKLVNRDTGLITQSGTLTVPAGSPGLLDLTSTAGVKIGFSAGAAGAGTSYVAKDTYSFSLTTPSFPVTSWREGDVARTIVEIDAAALAELDSLVTLIAGSGFGPIAKTAWLTLVGRYVYGLERSDTGAAVGQVLLSDAAGAGPFTIAAGQLVVASTSGKRYRNTAGGVLPKNGTLTLSFTAESPGASYNVGVGSVTTMVTTLPGVTATNPSIGSTGTWLTTQGVDVESDPAYLLRMRARWPSLGTGSTAAVWDLWAKTASTQVTRTRVSPNGSGVVSLYLAGPGGAVAGGVVTAVQAYVDPLTPVCVVASVSSAAALLITITGTIYVSAPKLSQAQAQGAQALLDYFSSLPIGGAVRPGLTTGKTGIVSREEIVAALNKDGVVDMTLTLPAADTELTAGQVATYDASAVTYVGV